MLILFQQARTASFQVNNKAVLSGISVFTLVKQGYINKTAFSSNLPIIFALFHLTRSVSHFNHIRANVHDYVVYFTGGEEFCGVATMFQLVEYSDSRKS